MTLGSLETRRSVMWQIATCMTLELFEIIWACAILLVTYLDLWHCLVMGKHKSKKKTSHKVDKDRRSRSSGYIRQTSSREKKSQKRVEGSEENRTNSDVTPWQNANTRHFKIPTSNLGPPWQGLLLRYHLNMIEIHAEQWEVGTNYNCSCTHGAQEASWCFRLLSVSFFFLLVAAC